MKTERLSSKALFPALLFLLFVCTGCQDEKYNTDGGTSDTEKAVTFSLTLPGQAAGGSTYALSTTDEEEVSSVEVLLFDEGEKYFQTRRIASGEITSGSDNQKFFTVKILEGTYSSIVVLANSSDIVAGAGLTTADTKAQALAKLNLSNSGKWVAGTGAAGYRPIPMWGEFSRTTVDQNTTAATQITPWSLTLTRMLAKVSVALTTPAAIADFKLQSIRVYNYYDKGSVAAVAGNWSAGVATAASVPVHAGAAKPAVATPYTTLTYSGAEITTASVASLGEIYLFESDNKSQTDLLARTCLVLGGTYMDSAQPHYYRVDFKTGTDNYLDILRNHHYKVNVTKISGPGFPTPDEAFSARPFNIEATVVAWNETAVNNTVIGQYMLSLSQMSYTYHLSPFPHTAADNDNKLTIFTDNPDGWQIASITDDAGGAATWLTVSGGQRGVCNVDSTVSLLLTQNRGTAPRSAKISIKAGAITMRVRVTQWDGYYPLQHSGWAGSNIYWDSTTGKLTFDDVNDQTHNSYQGVYFQWGSLWGISPADPWSESTILYPPTGGSDNATSYGKATWNSLPRVNDVTITSNPPSGKYEYDRCYLYELDPITGTGDICKYLTEQAGGTLYGKRWRMPTSNELRTQTGGYVVSGSWNNVASNQADGTFAISQGWTKTDTGSPFFPAGGFRNFSNGMLYFVGTNGYCWSASPSGRYSYRLTFGSGALNPSDKENRAYGFPVRCVIEE